MAAQALGLLETFGLVPAIEAADTAVKSADVSLGNLQFAGSGLVTIVLTGDISAVQAAIDTAEMAAGRLGTVRSATVIGRTAPGLSALMENQGKPEEKKILETAAVPDTKHVPEAKDLKSMKVSRLRQMARKFEGFPMTPKEIKFARKKELINTLKVYFQKQKE